MSTKFSRHQRAQPTPAICKAPILPPPPDMPYEALWSWVSWIGPWGLEEPFHVRGGIELKWQPGSTGPTWIGTTLNRPDYIRVELKWLDFFEKWELAIAAKRNGVTLKEFTVMPDWPKELLRRNGPLNFYVETAPEVEISATVLV